MDARELTAPGWELQRQLRCAMRGGMERINELLTRLKLLFVAEERWLYPEFAADARRAPLVQQLTGQHYCMLGLIDRLLELAPDAPERPTMIGALQGMLAKHVRDERALLDEALASGQLHASDRLARFGQRAWRTLSSGQLAPRSLYAYANG